jgi:hypothetical protein
MMDQGGRSNTAEILEALRRHDRRTWEDLYNSQWWPLCAFIRVQLGEALTCAIDPQDVAQGVFCRAYCGLFIKRYLEELSEEGVAEAEGMKRGTASAYLSRARCRLRRQRARFTTFL